MSNEISAPAFDYGSLDDKAESFVRQKTTEIRDRMGRAAQNVVEIGERLLAVKEALGHGQFGPWLATEFGWSESTATKMMQVANSFKSVNFTDLTIGPSALYLLAAPSTPEEVTAEVIAEAKEGKAVKHGEVKAKVQAVKAKRRKAEAPPPTADPLDEEGSSDAVQDKLPAPVKAVPSKKTSGPETTQPAQSAADAGPPNPRPWLSYNAAVDEIVVLIDQMEAAVTALTERPSLDRAFADWINLREFGKFFKNLKTQFEKHQVAGWANADEKFDGGRNFAYVYEAEKRRKRGVA